MTRSGLLALAALAALALLAQPVSGEEPSPPAEKPTPPPDSPQEPPQQPPPAAPAPAAPDASTPAPGQKGPETTWVDVGHRFVEQKVFAPVLRLDRFFSDERSVEAEREQSFLRWRSQVRLAQDLSGPEFTTSVSANLRLPGLNERLRRLRVVIAGGTRNAVNAIFPREQGAPPNPFETAPDEETAGTGDAGLRFYLWDALATHADLGGGFLLQLPPGVYGQLRFRWAFPVGPLFLTRTALIGFWRSDVKFGATGTLELNRPVNPWLLLRASGSGTRSERSNGLEWWSELAAIVPIPPRSAAQFGAGWTGATAATTFATDPATGISRAYRVPTLARSRVYSRLRTDVYRRWLFVEIEPEIAWPWSPERARYMAWGLMFRVEVQFQGKEAPPPAPPPPTPEPKEPEEPPGP